MKRALALAVTAASLSLVAACGNDTSAPPLAPVTLAASPGAASGAASDSTQAATDATDASGATAAEQQAATWLSSQLTGGLIHNDQYQMDDIGLSVDTALALAQVPGHEADVQTIAGAVGSSAKSYIAPGYGTLASAGAIAKTIVLDQTAGTDPGRLVGKLEALVGSDGRVADKLDPSDKKAADYANVVAQAYAVRALDRAGSPQAAGATAFLLQQQCSAGWFRLSFADPGASQQACDGDPSATPDVDTTALAVLALEQASDQPGATDAIDKAVSWLASDQSRDGSSASGTPAVSNANSTGLAGWALGTAGRTRPAGEAASWVAQHQLGCDSPDAGAIAYDDAAAKATAVTTKTQDQFRRATAQALPALRWLPSGSDTGC